MTNLLFVYGTLHPDHAPTEVASAVRRFTPLSPATIRGTLYQLDGYPGLVITRKSCDFIPGHVFTLPDDPALLARLDAYEGFQPDAPAESLFLRVRRRVTLADGSNCLCWLYLYNAEPPDKSSPSVPSSFNPRSSA